MRYRTHPKTGDKVSEIGFGTAYFYEVGMKEGTRILRRAYLVCYVCCRESGVFRNWICCLIMKSRVRKHWTIP